MTPQQTRTRRRRRAGAFWGGAGLLVLGMGLGVVLQFQPAIAAGSTGTATTTAAKTPAKCGNCQGNSGKGAGNGSGTGNPAKALTLTGSATSDLAPGRDARLTVAVTNPNSTAVTLTSVSATVTSVTQPHLPLVCDRTWITVPSGGNGVRVEAGQTKDVVLLVKLANLKAVNQDGCKGARYDVDLAATGTQA